jgi:hypothetical protein
VRECHLNAFLLSGWSSAIGKITLSAKPNIARLNLPVGSISFSVKPQHP